MAASDRDLLPDNFKPAHYDLSLYDLELSGNFHYQGTVTIHGQLIKPTSEIVINSRNITIHSATLTVVDGKAESKIDHASISYDEPNQRAIIKLQSEAQPSSKAEIQIKFQGTIGDTMTGFYRSKYKPTTELPGSLSRDGQSTFMFSTQFESCDARRAFPCFDEPNLKATVDFDIEIPSDLVALGNTSVREIRKSSKNDHQIVAFERTPAMSTYLIAWAVGDFEYVEAFTERSYNGKKIPVRVYVTKGLLDQTSWALREATRMLDFGSEIFGIDYPLTKLDLLAVQEFAQGAMENWGLITYRTAALLVDADQSNDATKKAVSYVIAHELAHQWFGNLVTMDWWSELWLNEGFATWVGWYIVNHFYPEWNIWTSFVSGVPTSAMSLDSLRSSHPIEVPLRNALEVEQIFDDISYEKGSSVIHMLSFYIGVETFLKGVNRYLVAHQYKNATTNDLWAAISEASGQDVKKLMDSWVRRVGFPLVSITEDGNKLTLRQERFLISGDLKPEEDETVWWIPLGLKTKPDGEPIDRHLETKEDTIDLDLSANSFYKLNHNCSSLFRVKYPASRLEALSRRSAELSPEDRFGLISDAQALARSGHGSTTVFFDLIKNFTGDSDYSVLDQLFSSFGSIRAPLSAAGNEKISSGLRKFALDLVSGPVKKWGWDFKPGSYTENQRRTLALGIAASGGDPTVLAEARRRFKAHISGEQALEPNVRALTFRSVIRWGGREEFEQLKQLYLDSEGQVEIRSHSLCGLGMVQDEKLAFEFLDFLFSSAVPVQDVHHGAAMLAMSSNVSREVFWRYMQDNWESVIYPRLKGSLVTVERFVRITLNQFASHDRVTEIRAFFNGRDNNNAGYNRGLSVALDRVTAAANFVGREEKPVLEWLKANKYI